MCWSKPRAVTRVLEIKRSQSTMCTLPQPWEWFEIQPYVSDTHASRTMSMVRAGNAQLGNRYKNRYGYQWSGRDRLSGIYLEVTELQGASEKSELDLRGTQFISRHFSTSSVILAEEHFYFDPCLFYTDLSGYRLFYFLLIMIIVYVIALVGMKVSCGLGRFYSLSLSLSLVEIPCCS